jgi:hypothetical protein
VSSTPSPSPSPEDRTGIGCKPFAVSLAVLIVFAAVAVTIGLVLALADDPSPAAERIGLALYVAGAPVSGVFAALVGELPLAPLTDAIVWLVAAGLIARRFEGRLLRNPLLLTMGGALVFGALVSQAIERV